MRRGAASMLTIYVILMLTLRGSQGYAHVRSCMEVGKVLNVAMDRLESIVALRNPKNSNEYISIVEEVAQVLCFKKWLCLQSIRTLIDRALEYSEAVSNDKSYSFINNTLLRIDEFLWEGFDTQSKEDVTHAATTILGDDSKNISHVVNSLETLLEKMVSKDQVGKNDPYDYIELQSEYNNGDPMAQKALVEWRDREAAIAGISAALYSTQYWNNVYQDPYNPLNNFDFLLHNSTTFMGNDTSEFFNMTEQEFLNLTKQWNQTTKEVDCSILYIRKTSSLSLGNNEGGAQRHLAQTYSAIDNNNRASVRARKINSKEQEFIQTLYKPQRRSIKLVGNKGTTGSSTSSIAQETSNDFATDDDNDDDVILRKVGGSLTITVKDENVKVHNAVDAAGNSRNTPVRSSSDKSNNINQQGASNGNNKSKTKIKKSSSSSKKQKKKEAKCKKRKKCVKVQPAVMADMFGAVSGFVRPGPKCQRAAIGAFVFSAIELMTKISQCF